LQKVPESVTIVARAGWITCPACGKKKLIPITATTRAKNLPIHCKLCGWDGLLNIAEPEPLSLSH